MKRFMACLMGVALITWFALPVGAAQLHDVYGRIFPTAEGFGAVSGTPPAAPAYKDGAIIGYVFSTYDVVGSLGFSGKRLDIAVGLDRDGHITGAEIVEHHEPILIIGISESVLAAFVAQYRGVDVRSVPRLGAVADGRRIDAVSRATVSSLAINDAVIRAARVVARGRGVLAGAAAALDIDSFVPADWPTLLEDGAVSRLHLNNATVDGALRERGASGYGPAGLDRDPTASFIELYAALATPASIGRNLLGRVTYERMLAGLAPGDQIVMVAARGLYSFKGTSWRRAGVFDRIQLAQGETTLALTAEQHHRVASIAATGAPELREIALFVIPAASGFDPTRPWRLDLLVAGESAEGPIYAVLSLPYRVPAHLVIGKTKDALVPLWVGIWRDQAGRIVILIVALLVLTTILVVQDAIVRRRRLYQWVRYGFLAFTVVWLGWYAGAQLSVVNVITFAQVMLSGFQWEIFLNAPLVFILWSYVALAMLFWGRGVFCGWLCPFGALHELLNRIAQWLKVPQFRVPFIAHERLWSIKYILFLGLFALAFGGYDLVQPLIEIEPFKTAIVLHFVRAWPFIIYVVVLLVGGLFVERLFCRYLCPLGAALAIPARLRMFEWLARRWQCGSQCQSCANQCTVQAIHPDGHINPNECVYCLNCQVLYYDDHACPPLIERRKRREKALRAQEQL